MCFIFVIDGKCFVRFSFAFPHFLGGQVTGRGNLLEPPCPFGIPVACGGVALITSLARAAGPGTATSPTFLGHIYLTCKSQIHPSTFCAV